MNNILKLIYKYKEDIDLVSYKKDQIIFLENDLCQKVGIVKSGEISIKSYFADGKEVTYNTLKSGDMFGNNLIFSSNPFYRGDVIALENSEIYLVSKESLLKILKEDEDFLIEYLTAQSDFSKTLNLKIKLLTIQGAEDRAKYYLTINKGQIKFKSITKLAQDLYLTRECLSRTLKKLEQKSEIKISHKIISKMVD